MLNKTNARTRDLLATLGGNFVELYDFTVYGYFAPVIARQFFPDDNATAGLAATFATFALGFLIRPFGAILLGHIGDQHGRRQALLFSLWIMAAATLCMALLPTYSQIGWYAPATLILLRMLQGLSMSGEVSGTLVMLGESATQNRKGLYASLVHVSGLTGILAGSVLAMLIHIALPEAMIEVYGWRLAFLIGAVGCMIVAMLRYYLPSGTHNKPERLPIRLVMTQYKMPMIRVMAINLLNGVCFFLIFIYINVHWSENLALDRSLSLTINSVNMLLMVLLIPLFGHLADQYPAIQLLWRFATTGLLLYIPLYWFINSPILWQVMLAQTAFSILLAGFYGSSAVVCFRLLPEPVRMTGLALGYNLAQGVFGSLTPVIALWLVTITQVPESPVVWLMATTAIALLLIKHLAVQEPSG